MSTLGWLGVFLLAAGTLASVIELALMAAGANAVGKRAKVLADRLAVERQLIDSDLERLRAAIEETERLWRPYRRILGWLSHPLTIGVWQSYRRRA